MLAGRPKKYATSKEVKVVKKSLRKATKVQAKSIPFKRSLPIFISYKLELPRDILKLTLEYIGIRGLRIRLIVRTLNNLSIPIEPRIE
jgi:hypothetical protein